MRRVKCFLCCCITVASGLIVACARAESWNYQTYYMGSPSTIGYLSIEQKEEGYLFRLVAPRLDDCWRHEMKALVERAESTIIVTPLPAYGYCESTVAGTRFVIKSDGSGGVRQIKKGADWVPDGTDRNLTIRK